MQKYQNAITTTNGNVVPNAVITVTVYGTNLPATLYTGNGTGVLPSNVITTDSQGEFFFYAANGRYSYSVSATNFVSEAYTDFLLFDPADYTPPVGGGYWVTPEDYGAVGDGVTDDGPAFCAAYTAAYLLGQYSYTPTTILCKAGARYRIKTSIIVKNNVALDGNSSFFLGPITGYEPIRPWNNPPVPASSDANGQTAGGCFTDAESWWLVSPPPSPGLITAGLFFKNIETDSFRYVFACRQTWTQCTFENCFFGNCNVGIFAYQSYILNRHTNVGSAGGSAGTTYIINATCFAADNPCANSDTYSSDGLWFTQSNGRFCDGNKIDATFDAWFKAAVLRPTTTSYVYPGGAVTWAFSGDSDLHNCTGMAIYAPSRTNRNQFGWLIDSYYIFGSDRGLGIISGISNSSIKNIGGELLFSTGPYPMLTIPLWGATDLVGLFENIDAFNVTGTSTAAIRIWYPGGATYSAFPNGSYIARGIIGKIIGTDAFVEYQPYQSDQTNGFHLGPATVDDPTRITTAAVAFHAANYTYYYRVRGGSRRINRINFQVGTSSGNIAIAVYRGNTETTATTGYPSGYSNANYVPTQRVFTTGSIACPVAGYVTLNIGDYLASLFVTIGEGDWIAIACSNTSATFAAFQATEVAGINENFYAGRSGYELVFPPPQVPTMTAGLKRGIYVSTNLIA